MLANPTRFRSEILLTLPQDAAWKTLLRFDATKAPSVAAAGGVLCGAGLEAVEVGADGSAGDAASAVCMALPGQAVAAALDPAPS